MSISKSGRPEAGESHRKLPELAIFGGKPVREAPVETGAYISERAKRDVVALMETGHLSNYFNGPWARRFEDAFAAYHGPGELAIAVNSGTSAIHLALSAAGIGSGDEVIVPALCFVAAATAIVQNDAVPIICDAEPGSLTLDADRVEALVTERTKAVLVVHFWGYPAELGRLRALCDRKGLVLIEDCAQGIGGRVDGRLVGTYGDFATFAFSVRKHVACGEGGMVLCRNDAARERLRELSNYGKGPGWDDYISSGFNYRLAEFPSIIGLDGLSRLDEEISARQYAGRYYAKLVDASGMRTVPEPEWGDSVFFKCPILLPEDAVSRRLEIVSAISAENISCRIPHRPLFRVEWLEAYLRARGAYRGAENCPVARDAHDRLIEIETGPHMPPDEVRRTGEGVMKVWSYYGDGSR